MNFINFEDKRCILVHLIRFECNMLVLTVGIGLRIKNKMVYRIFLFAGFHAFILLVNFLSLRKIYILINLANHNSLMQWATIGIFTNNFNRNFIMYMAKKKKKKSTHLQSNIILSNVWDFVMCKYLWGGSFKVSFFEIKKRLLNIRCIN